MSPKLARRLAVLSAREMLAAAGWRGAPDWAALPLRWLSAPLGGALARFDGRIAERGLPAAAAAALADFGASLHVSGAAPSRGALLVVANHPGAYDGLALMAALGRDDLLVLAEGRGFLEALPNLARRHLVLLDDSPLGRAGALRRVLAHLAAGGAVLHFAAGRIEPDPAFAEVTLAPWPRGTGALARAAGLVQLAAVSGVHSARAKRAWVTRLAERRGVTTFAALLQVAVPGYREVSTRVVLAPPRAFAAADGDDAALTAALRGALLVLLGAGPRP